MNDIRFCVYEHFNKITNEIFYVGSGTSYRSFALSTRTKKWKEMYTLLGGFDGNVGIRILADSLTKEQAENIEYLTINKYLLDNFPLLNKVNRAPKDLLTDVVLSKIIDIYDYDLESGTLRWKNDAKYGQYKAGDIAGSRTSCGYIKVSVDYKMYCVHHVILGLAGIFLTKTDRVDHINRIRNDNRLCNLRVVTASENNRNRTKIVRRKTTDNRFGVDIDVSKLELGVCLHKSRNYFQIQTSLGTGRKPNGMAKLKVLKCFRFKCIDSMKIALKLANEFGKSIQNNYVYDKTNTVIVGEREVVNDRC